MSESSELKECNCVLSLVNAICCPRLLFNIFLAHTLTQRSQLVLFSVSVKWTFVLEWSFLYAL